MEKEKIFLKYSSFFFFHSIPFISPSQTECYWIYRFLTRMVFVAFYLISLFCKNSQVRKSGIKVWAERRILVWGGGFIIVNTSIKKNSKYIRTHMYIQTHIYIIFFKRLIIFINLNKYTQVAYFTIYIYISKKVK